MDSGIGIADYSNVELLVEDADTLAVLEEGVSKSERLIVKGVLTIRCRDSLFFRAEAVGF